MSAARRLSWPVLVGSTVVALVAAVVTYALLDDGDDSDRSSVGTVALTPDSDGPGGPHFTTFEGDEVLLSSLQGAPLVVNFFASDCVPCIKEMPALEEVHQLVGDRVVFLGLAASHDRPEDALDLVERTGVTYRTARDKDASVISALGGTVLPTTVVLDAEGEVVASHHGEIDADELRDLLADELGVA